MLSVMLRAHFVKATVLKNTGGLVPLWAQKDVL